MILAIASVLLIGFSDALVSVRQGDCVGRRRLVSPQNAASACGVSTLSQQSHGKSLEHKLHCSVGFYQCVVATL